MPRRQYESKRFTPAKRRVIAEANRVCREFKARGYDLTVRQVYYQFIAQDLLDETWVDEAYNRKQGLPAGTKNTPKNYKRLANILAEARMAGQMDWDYLEDRTRELEDQPHWSSPSSVLDAVAKQFRTHLWANQPVRYEVWIEKDALEGVIRPVCQRLDVPFFSCRGYTSLSEMWAAAQRLRRYIADGQRVEVLHLGDHDPSGLDMTRDIRDRLTTFITQDWLDFDMPDTQGSVRVPDIWDSMSEHLEDTQADLDHYDHSVDVPFRVTRLALNWDQVQEYNPPPNPAKLSDSRGANYVDQFGSDSWELDALDPDVLVDLIETAVVRDEAQWSEDLDDMLRERERLTTLARRWSAVSEWLEA